MDERFLDSPVNPWNDKYCEMSRAEARGNQAARRASVYRFLSLVFRAEPSAEVVRRLKVPELVEMLCSVSDGDKDALTAELTARSEDEVAVALTEEYARLFIGPGEHIPLYESVQRKDEQGLLWGKSTVAVKQFVKGTGLDYAEGYNDIPDHISAELELLEKLTAHEAAAWASGDMPSARKCLEVEKRFLEEHLLKWAPEFSKGIKGRAKSMFYYGSACVLESFLSFDRKEIDERLENLRL